MTVEHLFVGARPLLPGENFLGREEILDELCQRLLSERIVLLHSPSGVGKTSLIRAGLIPYFTSRDFQTPNGIVTAGMLIDGMTSQPLADQVFDQHKSGSDCQSRDKPKLIVIDQCEEIFSRDKDRAVQFIIELAEVCRRRDVWVLIAVREDYLGTLLAVGQAIPGALRERVRLELLEQNQADRLIDASVLGRDSASDKVRRDLKLLCRDALEQSGLKYGISPMIIQVLAVTYLGRYRDTRAHSSAYGRSASIESLLAEYVDQTLREIEPIAGDSDSDDDVLSWVMRIWMEAALTRGPSERNYCRIEQIPSDISKEAVGLFVNRGILTRYAEDRIGFSHDRFVPAVRMSNRAYQRHSKHGFEYTVARWRSTPNWKWNLATLVQATSGLRSWPRLGKHARTFALTGLVRTAVWLSGVATVVGVSAVSGLVYWKTKGLDEVIVEKQKSLDEKQRSLDEKKDSLERTSKELDSVEKSLSQVSDLNLARMQARLVSWTVPAKTAISMLLRPPEDGQKGPDRSRHFARLLALELLSSKVRIHRELLNADAQAAQVSLSSVCGIDLSDGNVGYMGDCRALSANRWKFQPPDASDKSMFGGAGSLRDSACSPSNNLRPAAYPVLKLESDEFSEGMIAVANGAAGAVDSTASGSSGVLMTASRMSEARVFARPAEFDCFTSLDPEAMRLGAVVRSAPGVVGISTAEIGTGRARSTTAYLWRVSSEAFRRCLADSQRGSNHTCPFVEIFGQVHIGSGNWSVAAFEVDETGGLSARLTSEQFQQVRIWTGTPQSIPAVSSLDEWLKFIHVAQGRRFVVTASQYCVGEACRTGDMRPLTENKGQAYPLGLFPAGTLTAWRDPVVLLRNGQVVSLGDSASARRPTSASRHMMPKDGIKGTHPRFEFERGPGKPEILFHRLGSGGVAYHRGTPSIPSDVWTLQWNDSESIWYVSKLDQATKSNLLVESNSRIGAISGFQDWIIVATHRPTRGSDLSICRLTDAYNLECPRIGVARIGDARPISMSIIQSVDGYMVATGLESGIVSLVLLSRDAEGELMFKSQTDTNQVHSGNAVVTLVPTGEDQRLYLVSGGTERAVAVHTVTVENNSSIVIEPWGYVTDFASPVFIAERTTTKTGGAAAMVGSIYGEVALLNLTDKDLAEQLCQSLGESGGPGDPECLKLNRYDSGRREP